MRAKKKNIQQTDMEACVLAMEGILKYSFGDRKLLEDALTHPSFTGAASYGRLEFVGDAALGLAFTNFLYLAYPDLDEGSLTLLRSVNVSNEKLARVAVRHQFHRFIRHKLADLNDMVNEYILALEDDNIGLFGAAVKAPKVLADIVESIAAAVYIDCGFNLHSFWVVFKGLVEPIVTWEILQQQPQPVTKLFQLCQKQRKQIRIKQWRENLVNYASVYVDDKLVVSSSSGQKDVAKLQAAREALKILAEMNVLDDEPANFTFYVGEHNEIIGAKQKLFEICYSKKWPKPIYRVEEEGPSHDKSYVSCVKVEVEDAKLFMHGHKRTRVKDAENSAASDMIYNLVESGHFELKKIPKELAGSRDLWKAMITVADR